MTTTKRLLLAGAAALGLATALPGTASRAQEEGVPVQDLPGVTHVHGIAVDPGDPQRLLLATHHGFFTVGPDGVAQRVSEVADFMGFTPDPADPSVLYASGHPGTGGNSGLVTSTDAGKTWTQISPGANGPVDFHAMDVSRANPQVVYGIYGGGLQVSRDGGRTWSIAGPLPPKLIDLAASAADENRVYAATETGLLVSRDGGASWDALLEQGPVTLIQTTPDGALYAFVLGRGLMRATEPPVAWTPLGSDGIADGYLLHLAADPTNPSRLFAVTGDSQVLASEDGGRSWAPFVGRGAS